MNSPAEQLKCTPGPTFITVTLDDRNQKLSHSTAEKPNFKRRQLNRLTHISHILKHWLIPALDDFMNDYIIVTEISEALTTNGKYYPRLHYHVIGELSCPISCLLHIGDWFVNGIGSQVICQLSDEQYNQKLDYLTKQRKLWQNFLNKRGYVTLKLSHQVEPPKQGRRKRR